MRHNARGLPVIDSSSRERGCTSVTRGVLSETKLCRMFTSSKLLADYDTLVLNTGAHMPKARVTEFVVNRTRQLASWLRTQNHKLIWRTGVPGHVDCSKYSAPLEPGSRAAYPQRCAARVLCGGAGFHRVVVVRAGS